MVKKEEEEEKKGICTQIYGKKLLIRTEIEKRRQSIIHMSGIMFKNDEQASSSEGFKMKFCIVELEGMT
jgi:hypothetical protein